MKYGVTGNGAIMYRDYTDWEYCSYIAINWGWGGSQDQDSNGTIWYRAGGVWNEYDLFNGMIYNFS